MVRSIDQDGKRAADKENLDIALGRTHSITSQAAADRRESAYLLQRALMGNPNALSKARNLLAKSTKILLRRANQVLGSKEQIHLGEFIEDARRPGAPKKQLFHL